MEPKDGIFMLMRYTAWANSVLYESLQTMPEHVLRSPRPGRPGGILGVLGHILVVSSIWKAHLTDVAHGHKTRQLQVALPLEELRQQQWELDHWYSVFAQQQAAETFARPIEFSFVDGSKGRMQASQMLAHVANHATYHRGYVADMIYEAGGIPPTMDIPVFIRHELVPCG